MSRYPHLPQALHQLLEAGSWTGTPTELYAVLEPYRQEPWPPSPGALGMWLRYHGPKHHLEVEAWHDGTQRLLRVQRASNNLEPRAGVPHSATYRYSSWALLEQALPELVHSAERVTLVVVVRPDLRLGWPLETRHLPLATREWSARYPAPLGLWLVRGWVSLAEWVEIADYATGTVS